MITDQIPPIDFSLNLRGHLVEFSRPAVMAIINATPDSFYAGSRSASAAEVAASARRAIAEGADMLDIGAYSSRPGADDVAPEEEMRRLAMALRAVREVDPTIPVSVDTFRADVAEACVTLHGADIINDISGGTLDEAMFPT
ncbi:MAG: dihydropteroate synthase, partial [Paramuribaculum sp.]|nr:dihydropteroate synthase [Paramuribaculum sp.]